MKQRLDREGEGISFTEFTYMLLQSFDFAEFVQNLWLHPANWRLGSVGEHYRRCGLNAPPARRAKVFGMTLPWSQRPMALKFGKTESGTVWLSAAKTSPTLLPVLARNRRCGCI